MMDADHRQAMRDSMTSQIDYFEPFENEDEILSDSNMRLDEQEDDGEELFGDNMENDYLSR